VDRRKKCQKSRKDLSAQTFVLPSMASILFILIFSIVLVNLDYNEEIHTVTGAFKQYLRELHNTVVPFELFDEAMKVAGNLFLPS
jgi:hypothetical protein